MVVGLTDQGK